MEILMSSGEQQAQTGAVRLPPPLRFCLLSKMSRANFSGKLKGSTVALPPLMMANEKLKSFSPGVKSKDLKKGQDVGG